MNWLGAVLGLTSSGVTRLVDRLVAAGWVTCSAGQDARRRELTLTPAGTQRAKAILTGRQAALSAVLSGLSADERVALEGLLDKVVTGLAEDRLTVPRVCRLCDRAACSDAGQQMPSRAHCALRRPMSRTAPLLRTVAPGVGMIAVTFGLAR